MQICIHHAPVTREVPVIASVPHSGTYVPLDVDRLFASQQRQWLRNTDWHLPQVYQFLPDLGVTVLEATHSRYVVDLNRDPSGKLYGDWSQSLIAKENQGASVYAITPDQAAMAQRVATYHAPFHRILKTALSRLVERFGRALLLDLHSFMGPLESDICLGDAWGTSCSTKVTERFHNAFARQGFDVINNKPFSGGYIVRSNGTPSTIEALAIELRYTTYLDCTRIDLPERPQFDPLRAAATQLKLKTAIEWAIEPYLLVSE